MDKVRCPACRGSKRVPKLGGMIGECDTCKGIGSINAEDKPVPVKSEPVPIVNDIIKATAEVIPHAITTDMESVDSDKIVIESVKVIESKPINGDAKRALYKRKKV